MYRPPAFAVEDEAWCFDFIKRHSFGSFNMGGLITPMAFVAAADRRVLFGHLARANPQAGLLAAGGEGTAFFLGPHGYVSPAVYESAAVPTWNYQAVEVAGQIQAVEDDALTDWLAKLVVQEETAIGGTWTLDDLPDGHVERLHKAIVGFELSIDRLEGKAKLSQDKSPADQRAVTSAFNARGLGVLAAAMAAKS